MEDLSLIYSSIEASAFNQSVGGGRAIEVAKAHADVLAKVVNLSSLHRVLDFGCGIGRTMPMLRQHLNDNAILDGCDISSDFIATARKIHEVSPFRFFLVEGTNPHYSDFKNARFDAAQVPADYYEFAYSFSVFTHVDLGAASDILKSVSKALENGGLYYFTLFRIDDHSIGVVNDNRSPVFKFENRIESRDRVFFANNRDPYAFTALPADRIEATVREAGLQVRAFMRGGWRGEDALNLHDAYLVSKG